MSKEFFPAVHHKFVGVLANLLEGFIAEKRGLGFQYKTEEYILRKFSEFTERYEIPANTLPKEVVKEWFGINQYDNNVYSYKKFILIQAFSKYMARLGHSAYFPNRADVGRIHNAFIPHIFTNEEIQKFFKAIDCFKYCENTCSPKRNVVMPVLFRLLYCCGLRVSEVSGLKISDVDTKEGVLTIRNSKFKKSRYVPLSREMKQVCDDYKVAYCKKRENHDWFFPAPKGNRYSREAIYHFFRQILRESEISHGGKGKGPRLHDLRHTFAVHCLAKFVKSGVEPSVALPRLSSYLGHKNLTATDRYLRMTSEVYPEISEMLQVAYGDIIPTEVFQ